MTLSELIENTTIQGNVHISYWDGCGETPIFIEENMDMLMLPDKLKEYCQCNVLYMFCQADGYLHIEIDKPESER